MNLFAVLLVLIICTINAKLDSSSAVEVETLLPAEDDNDGQQQQQEEIEDFVNVEVAHIMPDNPFSSINLGFPCLIDKKLS